MCVSVLAVSARAPSGEDPSTGPYVLGFALGRYLSEAQPLAYLFESEPGKPYWRAWPWWILTQKCGLDVTPTTFRTSLATLWQGDIKDLQLQGGWKTAKTIDDHYKQHQPERHDRDFDRHFEPQEALSENEDDVAYG